MTNDICCAILINNKEYEILTSRLLPFEIKLSYIK